MRVKFTLQKRPETTEEKLKRLEDAHEKHVKAYAQEVSDLKAKLEKATSDLEAVKSKVK